MTSDIAVYDGGQLDAYRPQIMTPEAREGDSTSRCGCAPKPRAPRGHRLRRHPRRTGEKALWRPGAQKLLQWFQLEFTCERTEIERDADGRKHGITYTAPPSPGRGSGEFSPPAGSTADYDEGQVLPVR